MQSWEDIGIQLNIADEELAAIKRKHTTSTMDGSRHNSDQAFQDMIRFWVKQVNPPPTWSNFVKALERLNIDQKLTDQLRSKYCGMLLSHGGYFACMHACMGYSFCCFHD